LIYPEVAVADLYSFSKLLTDVAPDFVEIDGRFSLIEKALAYPP
jgi:hypothetical protein